MKILVNFIATGIRSVMAMRIRIQEGHITEDPDTKNWNSVLDLDPEFLGPVGSEIIIPETPWHEG